MDDLWFSNLAALRSHQSLLMPGSHTRRLWFNGHEQSPEHWDLWKLPKGAQSPGPSFSMCTWPGTSSSQPSGLLSSRAARWISFADLGCTSWQLVSTGSDLVLEHMNAQENEKLHRYVCEHVKQHTGRGVEHALGYVSLGMTVSESASRGLKTRRISRYFLCAVNHMRSQ